MCCDIENRETILLVVESSVCPFSLVLMALHAALCKIDIRTFCKTTSESIFTTKVKSLSMALPKNFFGVMSRGGS